METVLKSSLECPVCLEIMDNSCKVLPCQHTFHTQCLKGIRDAKETLQCPECKQNVTTKIENLPPNVLLMRILEALKYHSSFNKDSVKDDGSDDHNESIIHHAESIILPEDMTQMDQSPHNQVRLIPFPTILFCICMKGLFK